MLIFFFFHESANADVKLKTYEERIQQLKHELKHYEAANKEVNIVIICIYYNQINSAFAS